MRPRTAFGPFSVVIREREKCKKAPSERWYSKNLKALHNSALSKLESWVACVRCITALTVWRCRKVRSDVTGMKVHRPEPLCRRRSTGRALQRCASCIEDFLLGNCRVGARPLHFSPLLAVGKFESHACLRDASDWAIIFTMHLHNAWHGTYVRASGRSATITPSRPPSLKTGQDELKGRDTYTFVRRSRGLLLVPETIIGITDKVFQTVYEWVSYKNGIQP